MKQITSVASTFTFLASAGILIASCFPLPDVGQEGEACNEKGFCRKGFVCSPQRVCVKPTDLPQVDAGTGADGSSQADAGIDAASSGDAGADAAFFDGSGDASDASDLPDVSDAGADAASDGGDPCLTSNPCEIAPQPECIDANTVRTYQASGTCQNGECINRPYDDTTCTFGCAAGKCNPDPGQDGGTDTGGPEDAGSNDASDDAADLPDTSDSSFAISVLKS
ncbi:MAG: hypothetical protein HY897_01960 [Deltaproteobacteria bacterium]|nr:hypothetical protein [Deltaproteobacteria bacterium]